MLLPLIMLTFLCPSALLTAFEPVNLPDGTAFVTWEQRLAFAQTYHVAQNHPDASDDGSGMPDRPWKTISRAAEVLQPGERVVIHAGVYREWVKPARGGTGPEAMISYEAAPGEDVILKGSEVWTPEWRRSRYLHVPDVVTWEADLTGDLFEGANPFCLQNFPTQKDTETWKSFPSFELRRGQVFVEGEPLIQVSLLEELKDGPGRFWVEENGMRVHVRLPGDAEPAGRGIEITTREQVFAPVEPYLNYIRVKGLRMFHAANGVPIPPPQRGLLSATRGHHWIIEDCEIGHANTLGMDLGGQWWSYGQGEMQGGHIIRRNHIHHCGVSAISAWHNMANERVLVEDNLVTDNCWMPIASHYESAGIKIHRTEHSVIRRNVVLRTANGPSLWLDGEILNTRVTQNLLYHAENPVGLGSLFLEINRGPNLCDNNIVIGSGDHGFHEHDAERVVLLQNLFADGKGFGVHLAPGDPNRVNPPLQNHHRVFGNLIAGFPQAVQRPNETSLSNFNLFSIDDPSKAFAEPQKTHDRAAWQALGQDTQSTFASITVTFDPEALTIALKSELAELPAYETFPDLCEGLAPAATLLTSDFLGRPRPGNRFTIGPLASPPLDGTAIHVDPRRLVREVDGGDIANAEVPSGWKMIKETIPAKSPLWFHHEFCLECLGTGDRFYLGRLILPTERSAFSGGIGFNQEELSFHWLDPDRLLLVRWTTRPQGQGTNTMQTHLILGLVGGKWKQLYRHSQEEYARGDALIRCRYTYAAETCTLTIHEEDASDAIRIANPVEHGDPVPPGPLRGGDVIYITDWRLRLKDGQLEYIDGNKHMDLDARQFNVWKPEKETRTPRTYDIAEVARFLAPNSEQEEVERLRKLNPELRGKNECSGIILIDDSLPWRGTDERTYYMMEMTEEPDIL